MVDYIKKKIVEKLAGFTKDLKPADISLSFLTGKGHLSNLELNAQVISEALQLPPWVSVSRVVCDTIRAKVPFTNLNTDPVNFYIGQVLVEISTSTQTISTASDPNSLKLLNKLGGNPSKYSLIEKVIDGMRIEIRSILVFLKDPNFHAQLEMMDILIESTSWEWKVVPLNKARYRMEEEDSVINYKVCSWSSLKIEGWSTIANKEKTTSHNQLRLIAGKTRIHIAFKRKVSDSSIMCSRIAIHLGDLIWILTQSQLRAVSRLVQSLMDAAVRTAQLQRDEEDRASDISMESVSGAQKPDSKSKSSKRKRKSKSDDMRDELIRERIAQYREGKLNLPAHEVIQNSFHLKTGKVDIQLCDDINASGGTTESVQGSILLQVFELRVDLYLDQPAGTGRAHWNMANEIIEKNANWSRKLITQASKTQFVDLPSVNMAELRERGVVIRCAEFSVGALRSDVKQSTNTAAPLPVITSDKNTFNIPDDIHNPAFQVGVTLYFYPDKHGNKFLVPRPNVYIYVSPVHVNVHQESCLWLVEFIHGLVETVNIELALSVKDEGKSYIEERRAQTEKVSQLPGLDIKFKILFTKITLPLADAADDGRPKALQIETSAIKAKNCPLNDLLGDTIFQNALEALKQGWLVASQDTSQFPHYEGDLRALPRHLQKLLQQEVRSGRRRGESPDSFSGNSKVVLAPEKNRSDMIAIEGWEIASSCVHIAFADNYTHRATLYTKTFISDFPVHLWVFLPPFSPDSSLPSTPTTGLPSTSDPKFSLIAHVPSEIRAELERLQLLFIMRLKDSFNNFKASLMKFLDPTSIDPNIKETLDTYRQQHEDTGSVAIPTSATPTISGFIAVSHVEVSILLPTLPTTSTSQGTNTEPIPQEEEDALLATMSREASISTTTLPVPSPTGSLASLPAITKTAERGRVFHSTSNLPITAIVPSPPPRSLSAAELHQNLTGGSPAKEKDNDGDHQDLVGVKDKDKDNDGDHQDFVGESPAKDKDENGNESSCEDGFVMVKYDSPQRPLTVVGPETIVHGLSVPSVPSSRPSVASMTSVPSSSECSKPSVTSNTSLNLTTKQGRSVSPRQQKPTSPLKTTPRFILHAKVHHICALPNIKAGEITARITADNISLRELTAQEYDGMKAMQQRKSSKEPLPPPNPSPTIKARLEVGKQVGRFFPTSSSEEDEQDVIMIATVEGLDVSLLLPNINIMKDFFDDEYLPVVPLPFHIKVASTHALLLEDLSHGADHIQSMEVIVEQVEVHRGRELAEGANIFRENVSKHVQKSETDGSDHSGSGCAVTKDQQLLHSFSEFSSAYESHVQQHGRLKLEQPEHISSLFQELAAALLSPQKSPPPTYSEIVTPTMSRQRSTSELIQLRRENEQLRQVQRECERLSSLLKESQVTLNKQQTDMLMITEECKKTKEELVSYKQVMEKQQEHIEKLLTENFDLQRKLSTSSF